MRSGRLGGGEWAVQMRTPTLLLVCNFVSHSQVFLGGLQIKYLKVSIRADSEVLISLSKWNDIFRSLKHTKCL